MKFILRIAAIVSLCAQTALAQHYVIAPKPKVAIEGHRFNKRIFFAGIGLLAAAKTADAITTRQLLDRGGWENNPQIGRHPSSIRLAGHAAAMFAAQSAVFYLTERNHHAWVRWTCRVWLGSTITNHAQLAACNAGIDVHGALTQCRNIIPGLN